jgi:hypothetical protein
VGLKRVKLLDARRGLAPDQMAALNAVATAQADWLVASTEAAARFDLPWEGVGRPCQTCGGIRGAVSGSVMIAGLGDVVALVAKRSGLDKLATWTARRMGRPDCGCATRRAVLNRWVPFSWPVWRDRIGLPKEAR